MPLNSVKKVYMVTIKISYLGMLSFAKVNSGLNLEFTYWQSLLAAFLVSIIQRKRLESSDS